MTSARSLRLACVAAGSSAAIMERRASAPTPSFAKKLFSIVGAGLKEEIGANRPEEASGRRSWAGP